MLKAQEAYAITTQVTREKYEQGARKAQEAIATIEGCITRAAQAGDDYTVIHPMRIMNIDSAEERSGYLSKLITIIDNAGYVIKYNHPAETMQISWAQ